MITREPYLEAGLRAEAHALKAARQRRARELDGEPEMGEVRRAFDEREAQLLGGATHFERLQRLRPRQR